MPAALWFIHSPISNFSNAWTTKIQNLHVFVFSCYFSPPNQPPVIVLGPQNNTAISNQPTHVTSSCRPAFSRSSCVGNARWWRYLEVTSSAAFRTRRGGAADLAGCRGACRNGRVQGWSSTPLEILMGNLWGEGEKNIDIRTYVYISYYIIVICDVSNIVCWWLFVVRIAHRPGERWLNHNWCQFWVMGYKNASCVNLDDSRMIPKASLADPWELWSNLIMGFGWGYSVFCPAWWFLSLGILST